jgi:hypothetical protein
MKILLILVLLMLAGMVSAKQIAPTQDILFKNGDGELVKIFGPGSFKFGNTFINPVAYVGGVAKIGIVGENASG